MKTLHYGYVLPFIWDPPLSTSPVEFPAYKARTVRHIALGLAVAEMVEKGAVEPVEDCRVGFYASLPYAQSDRGVGGRFSICRFSTVFLAVTPFRMETVSSVLESMTEGEWMVSLDLKDVYFQVPINRRSRRFLKFVWQGRVYQF